MAKLIRITLLLTLVGFASYGSAQAEMGLSSRVRQTFGAWQVSCRHPPGAHAEKCALVQSVTAKDRPKIELTVVIYEAISGNETLLRAIVPLGVLLPKGLALRIDDQEVGTAPFLKCTKRGCVAEVVLKNETIRKMKKGKSALFIVFDTPEAGIGIPLSLQGFTDAFPHLR